MSMFPDAIIVKRKWINKDNEEERKIIDKYCFHYNKAEKGRWACDYTIINWDSSRHSYMAEYDIGLPEWQFERFINRLLKKNGKRRERKEGYTQYEVKVC